MKAKVLVMSPALDLYNPAECAADAAQAIPGARHVVIPSIQGHQAANAASAADVAFMNTEIGKFLA